MIHRDIKPENILLHDGHALVADFGIALAVQHGGRAAHDADRPVARHAAVHGARAGDGRARRSTRAPTSTRSAPCCTRCSPASRRSPDRRAGRSSRRCSRRSRRRSATRGADVPPHVAAAVQTALAKLPADRFAGAAQFAAALVVPTSVESTAYRTASRVSRERPISARLIPIACGLLALLAVGIGSFWLGDRLRASASPPLVFGRVSRVTWEPGLEVQPAISPDGRAVAYAGGTSTDTRIYVRQIAEGRAVRVSDDSTGIQEAPSWSPDGSRILFLARGAVFSAPSRAGRGDRRSRSAATGRSTPRRGRPTDGASRSRRQTGSRYEDPTVARGRSRVSRRRRCARGRPTRRSSPAPRAMPATLRLGGQFGNLSPNRIAIVR